MLNSPYIVRFNYTKHYSLIDPTITVGLLVHSHQWKTSSLGQLALKHHKRYIY